MRTKIRVLSVFDGISSAYHILQSCLGLEIGQYFSSEISLTALKFQNEKYAGQIIQLGDIRKLTSSSLLKSLGPIHFLVGGIPCEQSAVVNFRRLGFDHPDSTANLMYTFKKIRDSLQSAMYNSGVPFFWLAEDVSAMSKEDKKKLCFELGAEAVTLCGSSWVPCLRKRIFLGNIPGLSSLPDKYLPRSSPVTLQSVLGPNMRVEVQYARTITSNPSNQVHVLTMGKKVPLNAGQTEVLLGFPKSHTDVAGLSPNQRLKLLSKSWSIPCVQSILSPLSEMFSLV